ncbi:2-hydroxyacid dehydrogenase [Aquimarina sediminis]|uniref:2-hydroxyacid dehydrogenase n=1 Tax=Aquimarina sediminis TaxID=2070536 RepID=UPI000CA06823|nr:glyoxylate/hydroxypyruvate reductase A [Aquimarina sediminis]
MSIAIIFNNKEAAPWAKALRAKLPNDDIQIYPEVKDCSTVEFALCWKPDTDILLQFPNLKVIQSVGASIEHITRTQEIKDDIVISRIVDNNLSNDLWEYLLGSVLSLLKNDLIYVQQKQSRLWRQKKYLTIKDITISILGLGKIGAYVAEKFGLLGFKVKGWSLSTKNINGVKSYHGMQEFDDFLQDTDILINILPLTESTENILNAKTLRKTNIGASLINVGRGEHLVEENLLEVLKEGHLSSAILDVFRKEPLPKKHPFWEHPKIKITPHVASLTNIESATSQIAENYKRFRTGSELLHIVSLKKGY